jgi:hypothetical protein
MPRPRQQRQPVPRHQLPHHRRLHLSHRLPRRRPPHLSRR